MNKELKQLLDLVKQEGYRNIIFDLDRTITRLDLPWVEWKKQVTAALPPEVGEKLLAVIAVKGAPWGEVINKQISKDHEFCEQYIKICQDFEAKYFAHSPYEDLVRLMPQFKEQGASLYLWTSNTRKTAERSLLEMGILHLFTRLLTREDTKLGKPHKEGWRALGLQDADFCLMVGDSQNDELAAKAAGIRYYEITFFNR